MLKTLFSTFRFVLVLTGVATVLAPSAAHAEGEQVLSGGFNFMCSLDKTEGGVRCWGQKTQSGVPGTVTTSNLPYPAINITGVVTLAAGTRSVCALRNDGAVLCWGDNLYGAVGDANLGNRTILAPQIVSGLGGGAIAIGAGSWADHTCAITADFNARCWGRNSSGQLGNGNFITTHIPQAIANLGAVGAIATGTDHTCAITLAGAVKCWGFGGLNGDGTGNSRPAPTQVVGLTSGVRAVEAGFQHTCALLESGGIKCWGNNSFGQLGNGSLTGGLAPVDVVGITDAVNIAVGRDYSCARLVAGSVKCWGNRQQAGGGDGIEWTNANQRQSTPVTVIGLSQPAVSIAASHQYACAVVVSGAVECWGRHPTSALTSAQEARATAHLGGLTLDTRLIMAEYRHASLDYFFLTSRYFEKLLLKAVVPDFQVTGKSFFVYPTDLLAGTKPITRYYFDKVAKAELRGSHFYTLVDGERNVLNGLNPSNSDAPKLPYNEGVDSFAFTPLIEGLGGSCVSGLAPLYRAFRGARFPDDPNHRFTTDLALYNSLVTTGWDGEGVKMCVSP